MIETELALWKAPSAPRGAGDELSTIREVPLFTGLREADLKRVSRLLHARSFEPGEVVFREGQTGAGMYIVQKGEVEIVMRTPQSQELPLVTLREKQFFGELALLEHTARSATCVVRQQALLLGLFQSDLEQLIERNSRLGAQVLWNLARLTGARLRELSASMRDEAAARALRQDQAQEVR